MSDTAQGLDRGPVFDLEAYAIGVVFIGAVALFATAEGLVVAATRAGEEGRERIHADGILYAVPDRDAEGLITAGESGRVRRVRLDVAEDVAPGDGRWPSALAAGPDGAVALASGRTATVFRPGAAPVTREMPSLVAGLAFAPKGFRLAATHRDGVALWFPALPAAPIDTLVWKGLHLDVTFAPSGAFVVTSMQESALHGWRLPDKAHMRMTGYPSKTRSMSWDSKGHWLATSGADAAIVWPFQTKDGPMGKAPVEVGAVKPGLEVSAVAYHPDTDVLAAGYADGRVLLIRMSDRAELTAVRAEGSPITALAWSADGRLLAWGTAGGRAGLFPAAQGGG